MIFFFLQTKGRVMGLRWSLNPNNGLERQCDLMENTFW